MRPGRRRESVAALLAAHPDEVVFTSGGTEANNLAIFGLSRRVAGRGHLVCSPIEHPAVAGPVAALGEDGWEVDRPAVGDDGLMDAGAMAAALRPETRLAALILAHNETGAIQPVGDLARLAGRSACPFIPTRCRPWAGFRSISTPRASPRSRPAPTSSTDRRASACCSCGGRPAWHPCSSGAGSRGARPGTLPVALIVGLATALERWHAEADARIARWEALRDRLEGGLIAALGSSSVVRNGPEGRALRLPQTLNVGFPGLDGDALLMQLDLAGVAASLGSACASGSTQASPSLLAMRVPADRLRSSVRFSLGAGTTAALVDDALARVVSALRRLTSPSDTTGTP